MDRHSFSRCLPLLAGALLLAACAGNPSTEPSSHGMQVHHGAFCTCCGGWMDHLRANGLAARGRSYPLGLDEVKDKWGVPQGLRSCHTGVWGGKYVFEGHVPAKYIRRYLSDPPPGSIGLAVPGMPQGSPGMPLSKEFEPYPIYLLQEDGEYRFFARVEEPAS